MNPTHRGWALAFCYIGALLTLVVGTWSALVWMELTWRQPDYNHAYVIPIIAVFLLLRSLPTETVLDVTGSWRGAAVVLLGLLVAAVGELSAIFTVVQVAAVILVGALFWACFGYRAFSGGWIAFAYLLFVIPLPRFLFVDVSQMLQLISSELGVALMRVFAVSVYLQGNVIDLGSYKLQVVEACSGLRYLFPLMSFSFLIATLFNAPAWQRLLIFASSVPITIAMNSFRIAVIGVLYEHAGLSIAQGFFHYFEGWVIFLLCLCLLLLEVWLIHKIGGSSGHVLDRLAFNLPSIRRVRLNWPTTSTHLWPALVSLALVGFFAAAMLSLPNRQEATPDYTSLVRFPLIHAQWVGHEQPLGSETVEALKLTDYLVANYRNSKFSLPVNLYVAYYASQRKGASAHSPRSCIPAGGWIIETLEQREIDVTPNASGVNLMVNRSVISRDGHRQLVYYWFKQRGRALTNEYLVKWYIFWDSLTRNRSDGAMIRVVLPIADNSTIESADLQLTQFLADFDPLLSAHIPD